MNTDLVVMDADTLGPAMRALNPRQRAFVIAYCEMDKPSATEAARVAGYADNPLSRDSDAGKGAIRVQAARLMQRQDVRAAMVEECRRRLAWDLPVHMAAVKSIALNDQHRDQLKAALALMNRGGLPDVREVVHQHEITLTDQEKWQQIAEIYQKAGLPLPAGAPKVVDVTPVEIADDGKIVIGGEEY